MSDEGDWRDIVGEIKYSAFEMDLIRLRKEAEKERDRYKAALEEIAHSCFYVNGFEGLRDIARKVLEPESSDSQDEGIE